MRSLSDLQSDIVVGFVFRSSRFSVVDVIHCANCRRSEARSKPGVFNQSYTRNLRLVCRRVRDEPRMVLVLATLLAKADYLRGARFAGDVETNQLDSSCRAGFVHDRPHRMDHDIALVGRDAEILRLRTLERVSRPLGP